MMSRSGRQHRGFTLIEVLATLVLLGIVVPVAMRGVSLALAAASNARNVRQATSLAQMKLQELTSPNSELGNQSGDFAPEFPQYRWTTQLVSLNYGVDQIDLRVSWIDRGQERGVNVSTIYRPDSALGGSSSSSSTGATP